VTNLYVRDSLMIDMTTDHKTRQETGSIRSDQIGKVFIVVGPDVRRCLICEQFFTLRASADHAKVSCDPAPSE
jgi:hypothetical protein